MARLLFEEQGVRRRNGNLASGIAYAVYSDEAGTTLADISATPSGSAIAGSTVTVADIAGLGPSALRFYGPSDATDTLWVKSTVDLSLGLQKIEADPDPRLDVLEASIGGGISGSVALKPATGDAVLYVSGAGADANDGKSWGSAKLTVAAAITALPAGGGVVEVGAGTFGLGSGAVGLALNAAKPTHLRGRGRLATVLSYGGTGTAVKIDGTGTDPNDWGSIEGLKILCTNSASYVGLQIVHVHRGYIHDVYVLGNSYPAGSRGVLAQGAYGTYLYQSVVAGFETGIHLDVENHDFTIHDVNIGAHQCCIQVVDSGDVRIHGGQHSGTGATIGHQIIATGINGDDGLEILEVHYESNGLDLALGRAGDGSTSTIQNPHISGRFPSGLTIDRAFKPLLLNPNVGDGTARALTLTSNCTYPTIIGLRLAASATLSDSSGSPTYLSDVNGRSKFGGLDMTGTVTVNNNTALQWKDSGGTARRTQLLTGGNAMYFGDIDNALSPGDLLLLAGGSGGIIKGLVNNTEQFYVRAGAVDAQAADLRILTIGKTLKIAEGSNAKMGTATLVAGAATVATTAVTANSRILLTSQVDGGTPGFLRVSTRTAGTSFVITSSSATDTSTVAWLILEPA